MTSKDIRAQSRTASQPGAGCIYPVQQFISAIRIGEGGLT
jgi:hypothetical protein